MFRTGQDTRLSANKSWSSFFLDTAKMSISGQTGWKHPYRMPFPADDCWFSTGGRIRKLTTIIWTGMVVKCGRVKQEKQTIKLWEKIWDSERLIFLASCREFCLMVKYFDFKNINSQFIVLYRVSICWKLPFNIEIFIFLNKLQNQ